ncbi:hypothetical protein ACFVU2_01845 [Leifsonia sp. NPDC058194]|uniref:hypothetical protein n=1 Tax=Leifsonia sp. NPDC058194 TaxID=3346374 RepID=UPI0036D79A42
MRVFIISTANMGPELRGGLIGVVGSANPSADEKTECVEALSRLVAEGWAIAADPHTVIGRLAAIAAEAGAAPFVSLGRPAELRSSTHTTLGSGVLAR